MSVMRPVFILLIVGLLQSPVLAEDDGWPLKWLLGDWQGEGRLMNADSRTTLKSRRVLGGHFLELSYEAGMSTQNGPFNFSGHAFYRNISGDKWDGTWVDNGGELHPLAGHVSEGRLQTIWGTPGTKLGRVTYRLLADGRLEVVDEIMTSKGNWQEFGRNMYQRMP